MKTINKIITLILLLLFLVACEPAPEKPGLEYFRQEYGNLVITTLKDKPPEINYPGDDITIAVKLKNQGAYDLTNGRIKILGFDEKFISLEENKKEIISRDEENVLHGRSPLNEDGDYTFVIFKAKVHDLYPGAEEYPAPYEIKAEYDYKTELTRTVCINPKLHEIYDAGCKMEPKILLNGQGSPLAITTLEEIIHPGNIPKVEFRFDLKNKGRGIVKQVRLEQAKLSHHPLNCEFKNNPNPDTRTFDFKEKQEATLICKKTLEDQKSYPSTLFLDLSFTYSLKENKKITIKR